MSSGEEGMDSFHAKFPTLTHPHIVLGGKAGTTRSPHQRRTSDVYLHYSPPLLSFLPYSREPLVLLNWENIKILTSIFENSVDCLRTSVLDIKSTQFCFSSLFSFYCSKGLSYRHTDLFSSEVAEQEMMKQLKGNRGIEIHPVIHHLVFLAHSHCWPLHVLIKVPAYSHLTTSIASDTTLLMQCGG